MALPTETHKIPVDARDDFLQRQAFDLVAQLVQAAVIITDADGITRWVNPSLERLTGYQATELVGHTPAQMALQR